MDRDTFLITVYCLVEEQYRPRTMACPRRHGGFVPQLLGAGILGVVGATIPLAFMVVFTGFEIGVAIIQAYIFTILTCLYLNDALHPHH